MTFPSFSSECLLDSGARTCWLDEDIYVLYRFFFFVNDQIMALSSHTVSSRLVLQFRNSLQGLSIHNEVQLFWVPGHCGIIGNEEADLNPASVRALFART
jgi:hypothetical protein